MKRRFFTFFAFFFYIIAIFAEEEEAKDYLSLKVTPEIALMNGSVKEYVFDVNCRNVNNIESRLDWDVKNIALFKVAGDFDILDYIYTGVSFSIAAPADSGNMQDYDWLNSLTPSWYSDSASEYTNYSCHTNHLEKYLTFSAGLGGNIMLPYEIKVTPFIAYNYDYIGFMGKDGYATYKANNWKEQSFSGKVISYRQETNAFTTGVKVAVTSLPRTYIYTDFLFSPALSFTNAMDYHYLTESVYWDKFSNIWQLQSNLRVHYIFNKNHSAGLAGFLQFIPRQKGITSTKELTKEGLPVRGKWKTLNEKGGLERFLWTISLSYSFSL